MWTTEYLRWVKISDDAWVNTRNVAAVERRTIYGDPGEEDSEGIWVHVGGAKIAGTITLEQWHSLLKKAGNR